ncbi:phage tail protein [Kaistia adipata]|uniref:phage tail protein n=1 Tax=Kaistia adipata TaxID=166954 RepID=UPI0004149E8F|nr:phage tail protein [Kaistia adipata]
MISPVHLLPSSSTAFERALSEAIDVTPRVHGAITGLHGIKFTPTPTMLPYLVYEYGLGELTPYVPNLYELIPEGIAWTRVRGTPAAVDRALGWLGYAAEIEEAPVRRTRWNLFQLHLDRIRDDEVDLEPIEGVAELSTPLRSVFWRGFHGYDVRALEYGRGRWSGSRYGSSSGVAIRDGGAKWSFGRRNSFDHAMTEADLVALGVWIEPTGDAEPAWLDIEWPDIAWDDLGGDARSALMLLGVPVGTAWACFRDAAGDVIGYRRSRVHRRVAQVASGPYEFGGLNYAPVASGAEIVLVEALTEFGDGFGSSAASVSFILSGVPADPARPGALWLGPGELNASLPEIASTPIDIEFGRTVRERVRILLRF